MAYVRIYGAFCFPEELPCLGLILLCNMRRCSTGRALVKASPAKVLVILDVLCCCVVGLEFV